jgi:xenotropic and polytropic retrovirus receptor 1
MCFTCNNMIQVFFVKELLFLKRVLLVLFQFRIFTAPFHFVGFSDFWLADQLNSLSTVLLDLEYLICYYAVEVPWIGSDGE